MKETCLLCTPTLADLAFLDEVTVAVQVEAGLALAPRRHVARWRDLTSAEMMNLAARIAEVQARVETGPEPCAVHLVETGAHLHLLASPAETLERTAVATVEPARAALIAGGEDTLLAHLVPHIDRSVAIDAAVSFLLASGVRLVAPHLQDLLERGGRLRLLAGDYLNVTEPEALRLLLDLEGAREFAVFRATAVSFHPKSWMFRFADGTGALMVGSSNLSRPALLDGIEWNLRLFADGQAGPLRDAGAAFERLLARQEVEALTDAWIDAYAARRRPPDPAGGVAPEPPEPLPEPNEVQREALEALSRSRAAGHRAGLVVLATGLGKTYLAAFDSGSFARVLFVAHREEILAQAMATFRRLRPDAHLGRFAGGEKDRNAEVLFASVQTLARATNLESFAPDSFDYIVIDEFHHAAARTYRRIIAHFEPAFLLGLTATPERADGGDLLGLCAENLVHRCDMWEGIRCGLLAPFSYWGVPDPVEYAQIPWRSGRFDEGALTEAVATRARAENALEQLRRRGGTKAIVKLEFPRFRGRSWARGF